MLLLFVNADAISTPSAVNGSSPLKRDNLRVAIYCLIPKRAERAKRAKRLSFALTGCACLTARLFYLCALMPLLQICVFRNIIVFLHDIRNKTDKCQ